MDAEYKFTRVTMFYLVENKIYNKWIKNDNNNR